MAVYTCQSWTFSQAFADAIVASWTVVPGSALIATPTVHLIQPGLITPTPQFLVADFTPGEATFTGYTAQTPTLAGPANLTTQIQGAVSTTTNLIASGPVTTTNTIGGYWLQNGTAVVGYEMFPTGTTVIMANVGDYLTIALKLPVQFYQAVQ